jgi:glucosylceramidase
MKANNALDNDDHDGTLLRSAYGPFARYFVKFIEAYRADGVPVAAVTPQNEPAVALKTPGMELSPADEARFIVDDLAPALRAAGLRTSIYGWDQSWGDLTRRTPLIAATAGSLAGVAWHCYFGSPNAITGLHLSVPGLLQIVNECSTARTPVWPTSELLIASFRNWANAVAMWNLALDPLGGPVQPPNLVGCPGCTGLVTIDEQTHVVSFSRDYYQLGQVSRYVDPGAVRIRSNTFVRYDSRRPTRRSSPADLTTSRSWIPTARGC